MKDNEYITFPRYDLCPRCNSRVDISSREKDTLVECSCTYTYTIRQILDYWSEYYMDKDLD